MDPRVEVTPAELSSLLELQNEIAAALERVVALAAETEEADEETYAEVRSVASMLTSLASDLESADAPPTEPQRELFAHAVDKLVGAETR